MKLIDCFIEPEIQPPQAGKKSEYNMTKLQNAEGLYNLLLFTLEYLNI